MQNRTGHSQQRGFTLVELSIVLVIIGLIIGGVLTGQQVIQNARVTNAINGIQAYEAQFQTYSQNYGALPGDDATASVRFAAVGITQNGDGNGSLKGTFDSVTASDETQMVWADLRAADLVRNQLGGGGGANVSSTQPVNPFGGIYGFQTGALNGVFAATVLCMNSVPAAAAQAIDARLDDGGSNSGAIQAMVDNGAAGAVTAGAAAANYGAGATYIVCMRMN